MIEHHLRVKGLEGERGFLPSTPFMLLILGSKGLNGGL